MSTDHDDPTADDHAPGDGVGEPSDAAGVRDRLVMIGDAIPVASPAEDLIGIEQTAHRRRRRSRALAGLIGAGALVVGGAVVVDLRSDDDTGSIQSSADAETADDDTDAESDGSAGDDTTDDETTDDETVADETAADETAADVGVADDDAEVAGPAVISGPASATPAVGGTQSAERVTVVDAASVDEFVDRQLLAWGDGFLSIERTWQQQPFPTEFPEEIRALFSDEVVALIEERQPTTIAEATDLLSAEGLLDEVMAVLADHPEASEAIYSVEPPGPTFAVRFSTDGEDWAEVDMSMPDTAAQDLRFQSDGDRLVATAVEFAESSTPTSGPPGLAGVSLLATTDLREWQTIEVPVPPVELDLPAGLTVGRWPSSVVLSGDRWMISLDRSLDVDPVALLGDRAADVVEQPYGYSTSIDDRGVSVGAYDEFGPTDEITVTWAELGVADADALTSFQEPDQVILSGGFDGTVNPPSSRSSHGQLVGFDGGFVSVGEATEFSPDGLEWSEIDQLGGGDLGWWSGVMIERDGRLVRFDRTAGGDGTMEPYELDVDELLWRPVAGPTLPAQSYGQFDGTGLGGATVYTISPDHVPEPFVATGEIEVDGFRYAVTQTERSESYTLYGSDGGELVSETFDHVDEPFTTRPFDHRVHDSDGSVTISDPESGDALVTISGSEQSVLYRQLAEAHGGFDDAPYVEPEIRVLATDGERWIDELVAEAVIGDADAMPTGPGRWANGAVINGSTVLVSFGDGSIERFEF